MFRPQVVLAPDGFPIRNPDIRPCFDIDMMLHNKGSKKQTLITSLSRLTGKVTKKGPRRDLTAERQQLAKKKCRYFKASLFDPDLHDSDIVVLFTPKALQQAAALAWLCYQHDAAQKALEFSGNTGMTGALIGYLLGYSDDDVFAWDMGWRLSNLLFCDWYRMPLKEQLSVKAALRRKLSDLRARFDAAFARARRELSRFMASSPEFKRKVAAVVKHSRPI